MASTRLLELAEIISSATTSIHKYLISQNLPYPSFEPNAPPLLLIPEEVAKWQDAVVDATSELYDLLVNPISAMLAGSPLNMMSLNVIHRFGIANTFAPGEETTFTKIAQATGLSEGVVKQIIRHSVTLRVFHEPRKGVITHTARSVLMRDSRRANHLSWGIDEVVPAGLRVPDALEKWPQSEELNETGFSLANDTHKSPYEYFQKDSFRARRFADAMNTISTAGGFAASHVVDGYDWSEVGNGTVVDVGGSRGHIASAIAVKFPSLNLIVQDLDSTVEGAEKDLPVEAQGRVKFMVHSFFDPQPVVADVYFLRAILHNWPDKYCMKILRNLIPSLRKGARVIINDACLPEPGEISLWKERQLRVMSLSMKALFNAEERDADQWRDLFQRTDSRFRFVGIIQPKDSHYAIVEFEWSG